MARRDDSFNLQDLALKNRFLGKFLNRVQYLVDEIFETEQGMTREEARANLGVGSDDEFQAHKTSTSNPHSVTKTQVGLGSVTDDAQLKIASNLDDVQSAATSFGNIKQAATTESTGVVEKATTAEAEAGTADKYPDATGVKAHFDSRLGTSPTQVPTNADILLTSNLTVSIPSDYPTPQAAIDDLSRFRVQQGVTIAINIETGHQPTSGISVSNGDYGHFEITSTDAEVVLPAEFSSDAFVSVENGRGPVLNCLVDAQGNAARGYRLLVSFARCEAGAGVKGCTGESLWIYQSVLSANDTIWSGATGYALRASRGAVFSVAGTDFTGCTSTNSNGLVYVNRGAIGNLQLSDFTGSSASRLIYCHRSSKLNAHQITASQCTATNVMFEANRVSELDINNGTYADVDGAFCRASAGGAINAEIISTLTGVAGNGAANKDCVSATQGGKVNFQSSTAAGEWRDILVAKSAGSSINGNSSTTSGATRRTVRGDDGGQVSVVSASATGGGTDDLGVTGGGQIFARSCTTTNGTGSPDIGDANVSSFNAIDGNQGIIWA